MDRIYLVAGGTGGHINAALSVGDEFSDTFEVEYISGLRYLDIKLFKNKKVTHINSQPLRTKNPLKLCLNILRNLIVFCKLVFKFLVKRPKAVIGAGGYVCGPTLMAAKLLFIPVFIIEQNAVAGVTNKILAKFSNLIFTNFKETIGLPQSSKLKVVGNPIRKEIIYTPVIKKDLLVLLVFGGSLGATQVNQVVYELLKRKFGFKMKIIHQVGKDNLADVKFSEDIEYQQFEYIDDMQKFYSESDVILARAGASTISELRVVRRPTILIPFPFATDNHQFHNAQNLQKEEPFPVEVLDFNKSIEELANEVYDAIIKFNRLEKRDWPTVEPERASRLIKKEVLNYVRN